MSPVIKWGGGGIESSETLSDLSNITPQAVGGDTGTHGHTGLRVQNSPTEKPVGNLLS